MESGNAHLLVAIHDVGPRFEREVDALREILAAHFPIAKVAMLVVPNHWGEAPLLPGSDFANRLRAWSANGADVFVHGWFHRDGGTHTGRLARFRARQMTAGEGEFLGLDSAESLQRMAAGRSLIESVIGRAVAGFVAPAWLYGEGARAALAVSRFALAEDHWKVWRPDNGRTLCKGPVITWASRSRARIASSLLAARVLAAAQRPVPFVRIAVHPGDTGVPALTASINRTLESLARTRVPVSYSELLAKRDRCGS